jgi:hypothetical protein
MSYLNDSHKLGKIDVSYNEEANYIYHDVMGNVFKPITITCVVTNPKSRKNGAFLGSFALWAGEL